MITLSQAVCGEQNYKDKANIVWNHYLSRQIKELEPNWIHAGYELVRKLIDGENVEKDEFRVIDQIIESHSLNDGHAVPAFPGQPKSPMRIIHDGWKAGTPTWIFMGRSLTPESVVSLGSGFIAVQRTIPDYLYDQMDKEIAPATLWMAYNQDKQMGLDPSTSNVVGPAISFDQLRHAVLTLK